jgi:hypothetical protein
MAFPSLIVKELGLSKSILAKTIAQTLISIYASFDQRISSLSERNAVNTPAEIVPIPQL